MMINRAAKSVREITLAVFEQLERAHRSNLSVDVVIEQMIDGAVRVQIDIHPMGPVRVVDSPAAIEKKRRIAQHYGMSIDQFNLIYKDVL